ncbi:hypothetical protein C8N41_1031 [Winogradskyella sediminis]|nr:hypothetical protein C8N41_1031 [Winogradskyella sediminis]
MNVNKELELAWKFVNNTNRRLIFLFKNAI